MSGLAPTQGRLRGLVYQGLVILALAGVAAWLVGNTLANLAKRGITVGFDFVTRSARFPISEGVLPYQPSDSFAWAFAAGLANTLMLAIVIGAVSTALGLVVALARRSQNPLARGVSTVFVEALRNTPLVVQLLFWYALVTVGLPNVHAALSPIAGVFLTDRGLYLPGLRLSSAALFLTLSAVVVIAGGAAYARRETGKRGMILGGVGLVALSLLGLALKAGVTVETPRLGHFNYVGGFALTPELVALLLGLILYSAAFIGEIIRGGIDAVPVGQWEAGRALGLSDRQTLRLVVIPQALRVIIPPMTSQYVNVVKNTTLALVVGYPDISSVIATTINQTGQAVEGVLVLMAVFLALSLSASLFMNWYNRRIALVQR